MEINLKFKNNGWRYELKCSENIIGIKGNSGKGKTKLINDLYTAYMDGQIKREVVVINSEKLFNRMKSTIKPNDIVCVDNLETFSKDSLNELSDLIHSYNKNVIWIEVGHNNWIVECFNSIKTLNIDDRNKRITIKG
jgi:chromosomal replication initiation ATPase DnaA